MNKSNYYNVIQSFELLKEIESNFELVCKNGCKSIVLLEDLRDKIVLGEFVNDTILLIDKIRTRIVELNIDPKELKGDITDNNNSTKNCPKCCFKLFSENIVNIKKKVMLVIGEIHPIIDQPTCKILQEVINTIERLERLSLLSKVYKCKCSVKEEYKPARDNRLIYNKKLNISDPIPTSKNYDEYCVALLYENLLNLEIPTMEFCAQLIVDFFNIMPFDFIKDMGRQLWDESRHANICKQKFEEFGGDYSMFNYNLDLWRMTYDKDLATRLMVHQCIGEWIGVDGAIWLVTKMNEIGENVIKSTFDFICRDEINHVAFGNKWVRYVCRKEKRKYSSVKEDAIDIRKTFNRYSEQLIFPLNKWACKKANISDSEISILVSKSNKLGSIFN